VKEIAERRKQDLAALEGLNAQIEELQSEAALIRQTVEAYDNMLEHRPSNGRRTGAKKGRKRAVKRGSTGAREGSKTGALLELVGKAGSNGATPGELFNQIEAVRSDFSKPYVYTVLHKLKERNKLKEKGGRYTIAR
jgi:hypothetical protein